MQSEKNLVILYHGDDWAEKTPLGSAPETRKSFEEFYEFARARGINVFRESIQWFDEDLFTFLKSWAYADKEWTKIEKPLTPTALFDKTSGKYDYQLFTLKMKISKKIPVINSPFFRALFDNKFSQYLAFSEYMPNTLLAENQIQFSAAIKNIATEKVVVKEIYGSGGKQVVIEEKNALKGLYTSFEYPVILQDFIETAGIPDVSEKNSIADLRLVYVRGSLIYALSRIAKEGSFHTNFHQGAKALLVPIEKIPASCLKMAEEIQKKLVFFEDANYSLDFMFTRNGVPFFIEMNTTPGFDLLRIVGTSEIKEHYYQKLLDSFLQKTI